MLLSQVFSKIQKCFRKLIDFYNLRFSQQDMIIGKLRKFATNFDCHVTIVIHPRKVKSKSFDLI